MYLRPNVHYTGHTPKMGGVRFVCVFFPLWCFWWPTKSYSSSKNNSGLMALFPLTLRLFDNKANRYRKLSGGYKNFGFVIFKFIQNEKQKKSTSASNPRDGNSGYIAISTYCVRTWSAAFSLSLHNIYYYYYVCIAGKHGIKQLVINKLHINIISFQVPMLVSRGQKYHPNFLQRYS